MQRQGSFSQAEYAGKKKQTRRDKFLAEMERVVPWARLVARLQPLYPKGERGRPPIGLERMLRHLLFAAVVRAGRRGAGGCAVRQPGTARLCRHRPVGGGGSGRDDGNELPPLAGEHGLTKVLFDEVGAMLEERGLLMRQGTIVDATIIAAPPSTKNKSKARDPEMHQTKKGNQWHFGMKAHIGVDVASGVVHTVVGTAANEADINQTATLLHGRESDVFADAGYTGADKRPELEDRDVAWNIVIKRGIIKSLPKSLRELAEPVERALSQVRAWVEHPFHIVKNLFRHKKLRYRGLEKNTAQLHTLFALANLVIVKKTLLAQAPCLITPGLCLDPRNDTGNRVTAPISPHADRYPGVPSSTIMSRRPNRRFRSHCSVFP